MPAGLFGMSIQCLQWQGIIDLGNHEDSSFTGAPAVQQASWAQTWVLLLLLPVAEDTDAAAGVCPADALWLLAAE